MLQLLLPHPTTTRVLQLTVDHQVRSERKHVSTNQPLPLVRNSSRISRSCSILCVRRRTCPPASRADRRTTFALSPDSVDERTGRATYADDCRAWNARTSTTTCTSFAVVDGRLLLVKLCDGIYCRGGRKGVWHPLQPQPQPQDVVRAHSHYATLRADNSYKKRVTWFSNVPDSEQLAVVEYQGFHPSVNQPHGNARHIDRPFVCISPCFAIFQRLLGVFTDPRR